MRNNCGDANKDHRECLHLPSAFVTMRRLSLVCAGTFGAALGHVTLANRRWTVARTQIYCTICTETQLTENYFEWVPHARRVLRRERESVVYFLLFLQAHRETTAHFNATGLPSQQNRSDNAFRFKRAAFITNPHARRILMGLKSKVGLVATKASALRINLNIQGCSVVAPSLFAPSHAPLLLPLLHSHNNPRPRVH